MVTAEQALAIYEQAIKNIDDPDEIGNDVLFLLSTRCWFKDATLTAAEQQHLAALDDELVRHQKILAEVLPFPAYHPREEWWWFLHEGPQVREEVLQPS